MVTLGDVWAVIAALGGICLTAGALVVSFNLLFQGSANRAKDAFLSGPWKNLALGVLVSILLFLFSMPLLSVPIPGAKLLGMMILLTWMSLAVLGMSGVAMVVADRICVLDPSLARYAALLRAVSLLVIAGVFPLLGWFLLGPALIIASTGYGLRAIIGHTERAWAPPVERR